MDQKHFRNIFGIVILPFLTLIFFLFGAIGGKQPLLIVGFVTLGASLILQFLAMKS
jgi:hypothetical protein